MGVVDWLVSVTWLRRRYKRSGPAQLGTVHVKNKMQTAVCGVSEKNTTTTSQSPSGMDRPSSISVGGSLLERRRAKSLPSSPLRRVSHSTLKSGKCSKTTYRTCNGLWKNLIAFHVPPVLVVPRIQWSQLVCGIGTLTGYERVMALMWTSENECDWSRLIGSGLFSIDVLRISGLDENELRKSYWKWVDQQLPLVFGFSPTKRPETKAKLVPSSQGGEVTLNSILTGVKSYEDYLHLLSCCK